MTVSTNLGAPIHIEDFANTVKTFHKGYFAVHVNYESTMPNRHVTLVTPASSSFAFSLFQMNAIKLFAFHMLESYFWEKNRGCLITKNRNFTSHQRIEIVNTIVDFLLEIFVNPSVVQKTLTAQAAVIAFPRLEFTAGEATVSEILSF